MRRLEPHEATWWWVHTHTHTHRHTYTHTPTHTHTHTHSHTQSEENSFEWLSKSAFQALCLRHLVYVNELSGNMQTEVYLSIYIFRISCTVFNCRQRSWKMFECECAAHSFFSSEIHKNNITLIPMSWCNYMRLQFISSYTCSECIRHNSFDHFTIPP